VKCCCIFEDEADSFMSSALTSSLRRRMGFVNGVLVRFSLLFSTMLELLITRRYPYTKQHHLYPRLVTDCRLNKNHRPDFPARDAGKRDGDFVGRKIS